MAGGQLNVCGRPVSFCSQHILYSFIVQLIQLYGSPIGGQTVGITVVNMFYVFSYCTASTILWGLWANKFVLQFAICS